MIEFLKRKVERVIGDKFVEWLNRATGSEFQFERTGANSPDLVYRDGDKIMPVEVTTSYYNEEDAIMRWKLARKDRTASTKEEPLTEPDQRLLTCPCFCAALKALDRIVMSRLTVAGASP
jgi:hypothetical protein